MNARAALAGRRVEALVALPSVARLVDVLGKRCRDISWVRTSVSSLDRFATLTGEADLEALLARARVDPSEAQRALAAFAAALDGAAHTQIAALQIGPKLWFTLNGVALPWVPTLAGSRRPRLLGNASDAERLVLLALVGSGLRRAELARLTLGDVGSLDADGALVPSLAADPLAVRFVAARGRREFVTFFTDRARDALAVDMVRRTNAGEALAPSSPLVAAARARRPARINRNLIDAGNNINVELCVATGRFFRAWGPPGARFDAAHALPGEAT